MTVNPGSRGTPGARRTRGTVPPRRFVVNSGGEAVVTENHPVARAEDDDMVIVAAGQRVGDDGGYHAAVRRDRAAPHMDGAEGGLAARPDHVGRVSDTMGPPGPPRGGGRCSRCAG